MESSSLILQDLYWILGEYIGELNITSENDDDEDNDEEEQESGSVLNLDEKSKFSIR